MNTAKQQGFLILADITGFTPFVADTELDHSNEIVNGILKDILSHLTPKFTLAEVEGDAVFVYSPADKFPRGDAILEIIESSYCAFRDKKNTLQRLITCNCKACQMAPLLDLKFIVHYGEYIINSVGGNKKPLGTSVNVAHRLLKNSICELTGWKAYVLLTKDCVDAIGLDSSKFHQKTEHCEHIGNVETFSINLDGLYRSSVEERRVYLSKEDADIVVERQFPVPPSVLWEWLANPNQRTRWLVTSDWNIGSRPSGRLARGATNHCVNSKIIETILDYRPFEYYTSSMRRGLFNMTLTSEFKDIASGTWLSWHLKINSILPHGMSRFFCRLMVEKGMKLNECFDRLAELIQQDKSELEVLASA